MKAILTYDLDTTGLKTALFDPVEGRLLALAEREIAVRHPHPSWAEQEPEDWWQAAVVTTCEVLSRVPHWQVAAIGLSSQRETITPVSAEGEALGPA